MSTYLSSLNHIVFSTKHRLPCLNREHRHKLMEYFRGTCKGKKCLTYAANGTADHVHILLSLHPSQALSDLVKTIKLSSSEMIREKQLFPGFKGWQEGYGHFTYEMDVKESLIRYNENQEEHHRRYSSQQEILMLLTRHKVEFKPSYLV